MATALLTHADCLRHITPEGHPERVARLQAILSRLDEPKFRDLIREDAPLGTAEQVTLAHPQAHFDAVANAVPARDFAMFDSDTILSPGSLAAALRDVGAVTRAVDMVLSGEATNAFCAIRPPGHHAEARRAMGFCLFGNVAIAAKYAIAHHGLSRVAIFDFDVHHGNGTQDLVWDDPGIFFGSTHQMPLYPGTGSALETGGYGNILNVPLAPGADGTALLEGFRDQIIPAARAFDPQLVIVSAGFDGHFADPLAGLCFETEDFAAVTQAICDFAAQSCAGRVVSALEGGYNLAALADSVAAHVSVLMEQTP